MSIHAGFLDFQMIQLNNQWFEVYCPDVKPIVQNEIIQLMNKGIYPATYEFEIFQPK